MEPQVETTVDGGGYLLGHDPDELRRLNAMSRVIDPVMRRFLLAAGLAPGMRVLDVGSGAGDVSFLAADIVGEAGSVTGVDRSADAIATATAAAPARDLQHARFVRADLDALTAAEPFDAMVGRYVLQWLPDPSATLRTLSRLVRPGGIVVFHEVDWGGAQSYPPAPLWDATCHWVSETIRRAGAQIRGTTLRDTFLCAGLGRPTIRIEAVAGDRERTEPIDLVTNLARSVAGAAETEGIVTAREMDIETLHERLRQEATAIGSVLVAHNEVGAWARAG